MVLEESSFSKMNQTQSITEGFPKETDTSLNELTYFLLFAFIIACVVLQYLKSFKKSGRQKPSNIHFTKFQFKYFAAYFLALFGDWLQGPYIYKLYKHYGFTSLQIAVLYVVGFSASLLFGTGAGALADRFGRKKMCMLFCLTYSLCCLMKLSKSYNVLLLGRLMGGISTSLLFSVFEAWYIYEHVQKHDFPTEWIPFTFSTATFWNGVLAIVAGVLANYTSETLGLGPVSPFVLAIPFFIASCAVIFKTWEENYEKQPRSLRKTCSEALILVMSKQHIYLLGIVQSLFECVMYVFVFIWTPILDPKHPPLGLVFSVFMVCIMIGSSIYELSHSKKVDPEVMLLVSIIMALVSQCCCALATSLEETNVYIAYFSFLLLEVAVGIYYPAIGFIKSEYIPESQRASIMNLIRVPLNIMTCIMLLCFHNDISSKGDPLVFLLCAGMMLCSVMILLKLMKIAKIQYRSGMPFHFSPNL